MKYDCGFKKSENWFRYRAGAVVVHNDKLLFVQSSIGDYLYIVGGGVRLGETSISCVEREIFEEIGIKVNPKRLSVVCENFFKGKGGVIDRLDCHTIEFYYLIEVDDISLIKEKTDNGENLVWIDLKDLKKNNIKPKFIKERIDEILNSDKIIHIIEESDR